MTPRPGDLWVDRITRDVAVVAAVSPRAGVIHATLLATGATTTMKTSTFLDEYRPVYAAGAWVDEETGRFYGEAP